MMDKLTALFKKRKILTSSILLLALFLIISYANRVDIAVTGKEGSEKSARQTSQQKSFFSGLFTDSEYKTNLDPAGQIFLEKKPQASKEETEKIIRYFNQVNNAIPLTTEALRFALTELILGVYEPIKDAILRLEEGGRSLQGIEPPLDAVVFHRMSIELLKEYRRILSIPLSVPRDQFNPNELDDDFERLAFLAGLARRELELMRIRYGVPLFPKSMLFYDEAIGISR